MWGMLENVNTFIQTTVGHMPVAVLTIALLATPTILYLIYRLSVNGASHGKSRTSVMPTAQWVCPSCRSVNELTAHRCYRCGFDVDQAADVLVIDPLTAKPISPAPSPDGIPLDRPGVAVGPGTALPAMMRAAMAAPTRDADPIVPATLPTTIPGAAGSPGVPVGPGLPAGVPVTRTPAGSSIGAAVGARRPFDPPPATPRLAPEDPGPPSNS